MTPAAWPRLKRNLVDAQQYIPFYRELWSRAGIDTRSLRSIDDLQRLPIVTRRDLIAAGTQARLDARHAASGLRGFSTSGSTGEPLQLLFDKASLRRRQIRFLRALWACGYRPGQRAMLVSSRPSGSVKQVTKLASFLRWHYIDLYAGERAMAEAFTRIRPRLLYGPQNALLALASATSGKPAVHPPRLLVSTSERLTVSAERVLQAHFRTNVTDFYGLTEVGLIAWRRGGAHRYDCATRDVLMEFVGEDATGCSQLVVTDLTGGSMPLYRYATGDLVRRDASPPQARVVEFAGKQLDSLLMPDESRIAPYLVDGALAEIEGLIRYRIVQNRDLGIHAWIEADSDAVVARARTALDRLCAGRVPLLVQPSDFADEPLAHKARPVTSLAGRAP